MSRSGLLAVVILSGSVWNGKIPGSGGTGLMQTFRGDLIKAAFEGKWPLWSTAAEVAAWFERSAARPEMRRAYELGKVYRERGLTADEKGELDVLANSGGWFARWGVESAAAQEMKEAWDRALGNVQ